MKFFHVQEDLTVRVLRGAPWVLEGDLADSVGGVLSFLVGALSVVGFAKGCNHERAAVVEEVCGFDWPVVFVDFLQGDHHVPDCFRRVV